MLKSATLRAGRTYEATGRTSSSLSSAANSANIPARRRSRAMPRFEEGGTVRCVLLLSPMLSTFGFSRRERGDVCEPPQQQLLPILGA
jgi:hypothetical protein